MAKTKTPTKKKEPKHPDRDEFDLEEIANALTEAMEEKQTKVFSIYKHDETLEGTVTKMDVNTKLIHIKDKYYNIHKVHFLDILSIFDTEY
ncbi:MULTISPECIES: YolD-like family protein [Lysinibacillus]|uniref:YolD-like family protein n=1 Tax=Lysinibacillus irui TaxID=2998077 RepID=A0AAJ5RHE5_9BACI|nr:MULTISPECIES: YolD-like family protein [Lysinibacillus]WDV05046.1 YolD-like family protein [Lysinibacillus irui]